MKEYKFNGKWSDTIELQFFPKLSSDRFFRFETRVSHKKLLKDNKIPLSITDERTLDPYPTTEQINAINFLLNNEKKIYKSVYQSLKKVVIPTEKARLGYEGDEAVMDIWFPKLHSIDDMDKVLGISSIGIDISYQNGIAWSSYCFEFSGDEEHGLVMTFEGDKFLDHGAIGDYTHENIMTPTQFRNYVEKLNRSYPAHIYEPDNEFGILKPWQKRANDYYPNRILRERKKQELIEYLHKHPKIAIEKIDILISNSEYLKFNEITKELYKLKEKR